MDLLCLVFNHDGKPPVRNTQSSLGGVYCCLQAYRVNNRGGVLIWPHCTNSNLYPHCQWINVLLFGVCCLICKTTLSQNSVYPWHHWASPPPGYEDVNAEIPSPQYLKVLSDKCFLRPFNCWQLYFLYQISMATRPLNSCCRVLCTNDCADVASLIKPCA